MPGVVVLVQFIVVLLAVPLTPGVAVVVVLVAFGLVLVTGVPGVVAGLLGFWTDPGACALPVEVLLCVVLPVLVLLVVAVVPGGQFGIVDFVVVFVFVVVGVCVCVCVCVFVVVFVVPLSGGVVWANAGTARLTTSPATDAKPRIARELMRLILPRKQMKGLAPVTQTFA